VKWLVGALLLTLVVVTSTPAYAAVNPNVGYDVGYPQCGSALPADAGFGIVGVNNGLPFSTNPCLASEFSWASQSVPQFYINTADPGPKYSGHWPTGQQTPKVCDAAAPNSKACSYDYGWNFANDSFASASGVDANAAKRRWWLDVETGNSWQTQEPAYTGKPAAEANDTAALTGARDALKAAGVTRIGFYSTSYQWGVITGGSSVVGTRFANNENWLAGFTSKASAKTGCSSTSFTGGPVRLTQYPSGDFDADWRCT
jgi:hypothetical protein